MGKPVVISRTGRVTLDLLAFERALESGTLSRGDRRTVERLLPREFLTSLLDKQHSRRKEAPAK